MSRSININFCLLCVCLLHVRKHLTCMIRPTYMISKIGSQHLYTVYIYIVVCYISQCTVLPRHFLFISFMMCVNLTQHCFRSFSEACQFLVATLLKVHYFINCRRYFIDHLSDRLVLNMDKFGVIRRHRKSGFFQSRQQKCRSEISFGRCFKLSFLCSYVWESKIRHRIYVDVISATTVCSLQLTSIEWVRVSAAISDGLFGLCEEAEILIGSLSKLAFWSYLFLLIGKTSFLEMI